ncbi:MAG: beta-ketoacyl-[acyl-carrier-protein] synthase II, partial [Chloroflexota bacterium]|nr:beta-ketoacyl-[acyl-carrier-protein] synthase II [Chloroflexota bacterium]
MTGVGAVSPIGNDAETFWRNLVAGCSGVARIAAFDPTDEEVRIAAEVKGFDPAAYIEPKAVRRMSRFSQLAVAAAAQAIEASR